MSQFHPLISFSLYLGINAQYLCILGREIIQWLGPKTKPAHEIYGQFWLWVLGAYEVSRVIADPKHKDKFSPELVQQAGDLKLYLTVIRMPFAKQEIHRNKKKNITDQNSIKGIESNDFIFKIDGTRYSAADTIRRFIAFYQSIKSESVMGTINPPY